MFLNNISIKKMTIGGIKNPTVSVIGKKGKNCTLKVKINDKYYELLDDITDGRKFIENIIDKDNEYININSSIVIPKNARKVELYAYIDGNEYFVLSKKTNILLRLIKRFFYSFVLVYRKIQKIFILTFRFLKKIPHIRSAFCNRKEGIRAFYYDPFNIDDYNKWLKKNKENVKYMDLKYRPLVSVIVPVYNVDRIYLKECIDSVLNQSYQNFELILVDDCSSKKDTIDTLKEYENVKKVKIVYRKSNGHISEATNTGLENANGDFISLLDNDDTLDKDALYFTILELNKDRKLDLIYTDEDKIYNNKYCYPHFKPDYSPDTLYTVNYICHFTTIRTSIVKKVGGFNSEYNGAQDYDLFLRVIEKTKNICHIPRVLYHWRMIETSTAASGSNKNYAYLAGKKAIEASLKRKNIYAQVNLLENVGMYDVEYLYDKEPKVSIIIPTKDKAELVDKCLKSIYNHTNYKNYEIIVINNNSSEKNTFELLDKYKKNNNNFDYITLNCEFNFSYINNEAVRKSTGDYIVLLNNDIEIISDNWLSKMVGYASQKHIGCVGIKLLYPNNTVQHCGVVLGCGGVASHAFLNCDKNEYGYFSRLFGTYNYSAVTAACLMIEKSKFEEVSGLDENLKVAYNDVDLNMKMLEKNYYNVCIPSVIAYHYESVSRGSDFSAKNKSRFISEMRYMANKWKKNVLNDKFYNINLSVYYPFYLDKNRSIADENKK